jgi:uncharacterized membrane protein (DUF485 family)
MRLNSKPVKVYKSTISCVMYVLLFSAGIAFCIWVAISNFNNDALSWIMVLALGVMAVACVNQMIYYIRCCHEKIVITEQYLSISQCVKQTRDGDWIPVKNVKIPWTDINHISAQWERPTSKSIRKNVLVNAGKKDTYLIDPDIFDVFFLEKKLQNYHNQYGRK